MIVSKTSEKYRENYNKIDWSGVAKMREERLARENEERKESKSPTVLKEFEPYYHIGIGEQVKSRKHWRELKRKHNLVEIGTEDIRSPKNRGKSRNDIRAENGKTRLTREELMRDAYNYKNHR
jgi:hypothetical protein